MTESPPDPPPVLTGTLVARGITEPPVLPAPTAAGAAALAAAQALARQAAAPATLRAYQADWQHFARWCAASGFVPVPA